jgi:hypothetical protein
MKDKIEVKVQHEVYWEMLMGYFSIYWRGSFERAVFRHLRADDTYKPYLDEIMAIVKKELETNDEA